MYRRVFFSALSIACILINVCNGHRDLHQSFGNDCREYALLNRNIHHRAASKECPIRTKKVLRHRSSIGSAIPPEWNWALRHNGTISGQSIFFDYQEFFMVTVKDCVERDDFRSSNARRLFSRNSEGEVFYAYAGNFDTGNAAQNSYWDCVRSSTNRADFTVLDKKQETFQNISKSVQNYILFKQNDRGGRHFKIKPLDFNYSEKEIEKIFSKIFINATSWADREKELLQQDLPISTNSNPSMIGFAFLSD